jgi:hypothetical protein
MEVASQGNKWGRREVGRMWRCGWWRYGFYGWRLMDSAGAVLTTMVFFDRNRKKE